MTKGSGLSSKEAALRLLQYGPNTIPEMGPNRFLLFIQKFWGTVPWMLEAIIILELVLEKYPEAWIIFALLISNAIISFVQEDKAQTALILLKSKLHVQARVFRDKEWKIIPAQDLVPDDLIRIRTGDIIPADLTIVEGALRVDQSALTGESLPIERLIKETLYAGSIVQHGEAFALVTATGTNSYFGKTAEIMHSIKTPSHLEETIFSIVKYLVVFDAILVCIVFSYALYAQLPLIELIPFSLLLLVASVPVALPATYALATALGSFELAKQGILITHLSAIEEAAAMDILCIDKTGTLTENIPVVSATKAYAPFSDKELLSLAAFTCLNANNDPIDRAIIEKAKEVRSDYSEAALLQFFPFSQSKKRSEAIIEAQKEKIRVCKGAPATLLKDSPLLQDVTEMAASGARVLAVTANSKIVGLLALEDPPRPSSKEAITALHEAHVQPMMLTGDSIATGRAIALRVGIGKTDVIAEIFPQDKYAIIKQLQKEGHICGMTGDGVNDAPALKQAEVGIATSNATDVAKAAASIVLTNPGITDIVKAIQTSRQIYQRMLTYTLNKIVKTLEIAVLIGLGLVFTNSFVISQLLIVLLFFTNDFVTMSIAADRVSFSKTPDRWDIKKLMSIGAFFAVLLLLFSFSVLFAGKFLFHFATGQIQTLVFLTLVFTGQATVYLVRERNHFWHSSPSPLMLAISCVDIVLVGFLACMGILMAPLSPVYVVGLLALVGGYFLALDFIKVRLFKKSIDKQF